MENPEQKTAEQIAQLEKDLKMYKDWYYEKIEEVKKMQQKIDALKAIVAVI